MAHRASTRSLQIALSRSWVSFVALFQPISLSTVLLVSSITVRLLVVLGSPLFFLPSGVHVSVVLTYAVGSILCICPSLFYLRRRKMIQAIASCPVACRSLAFEILLGQNTDMLILRQVVWKVAYPFQSLMRPHPCIPMACSRLVL